VDAAAVALTARWIRSASPAALAGVLLASAPAAQVFQSTNVDVGLQVLRLAVADVDSNGVPDLVAVGGAYSNEASVTLGLGQGHFDSPQVFTVESDLRALALADLNEDGVLDLVLGVGISSSDGRIVVRLGRGDGTFRPPVAHPTGPTPHNLAVVDLDRDGHLDVVATCPSGQCMAVLYGAGDGTFPHGERPPMDGYPLTIAIGALDGDAWPDAVVGYEFHPDLTVLRNDGAGHLLADDTITLPNSGGLAVALGDPNADGRLDAVVGNFMKSWMLAGTGNGAFAAPVELPPFMGHSVGVRSLIVVDIDEDGIDDVVADGMIVWLSKGSFGFDPPQGYAADWGDPIAADVNGDGDLDLVSGATPGAYLYFATILTGRGDGTFAPNLLTAAKQSPFLTRNPAFGDLDGDGRKELLVGNIDGDVVVFHALGLGSFAKSATLEVGFGGFAAEWIALADFREDGALDCAATYWSASDSGLKLFFGDGRGGFSPPTVMPLPDGSSLTGIVAVDLNGDQHSDLVRRTTSSGLAVHLGHGDGTFQSLPSVAIGDEPGSVLRAFTLGDFNADGDLDVAVVLAKPSIVGPDDVGVLLGDGTGAFGPPAYFPSGGESNAIASGDLDGDGVPDLVTNDYPLPNLHVHLANGDGTFAAPTPTSVQVLVSNALAVADFDGDGMSDVVCSGVNSTAIMAFLQGQGDGSFGAPQVVPGTVPPGLTVDDIDGDGWLDVATGSAVVVKLFLNQLGPWHTVGDPLAGTLGLPKQTGEGSLQPGSKFEIALHDARPLTPATQVVGLAAINAPFKGGTMIPAANLVISPLFTDAAGDLALSGSWPLSGLTGLTLYFQFWIPDPAGVKGWTSSAGLQATVP
jgi:hypothetical protein